MYEGFNFGDDMEAKDSYWKKDFFDDFRDAFTHFAD